jgi:hypothetical protein
LLCTWQSFVFWQEMLDLRVELFVPRNLLRGVWARFISGANCAPSSQDHFSGQLPLNMDERVRFVNVVLTKRLNDRRITNPGKVLRYFQWIKRYAEF